MVFHAPGKLFYIQSRTPCIIQVMRLRIRRLGPDILSFEEEVMIFPEPLLGVGALGGLCCRKGIGVCLDKRKVVKDDLYRFSIFFKYLFQWPLGLLACRALEVDVLYDPDPGLRGSLDRISLTIGRSNPRYAGNEVSSQDDRRQDSHSDPGPAFGLPASAWSWSCGFLRFFPHEFSVSSVVFRQRLAERRGCVNFTEQHPTLSSVPLCTPYFWKDLSLLMP